MSMTYTPPFEAPSEADKQRAERSLHVRIFSEGEMGRRLVRLRSEMAARGLQLALFTDEVNVVYFTGMAVPSFVTRTRPLAVLVPLSGSAVLVCSRSQSANARSASAIQEIVSFERFEADAVDVLTDLVGQLTSPGDAIGCEIGPEQRIGLTYQGFQRLVAALAGRDFVDVGPALWPVRLVKGPEEIALMRRAGAINEAAMAAAVGAARPGATERAVRDAWAHSLATNGADRPGYLAIHSGPGNYRRISSSGTDRVLGEGDLVWFDGGPVYRGYWSDVTRMVSIGPARPIDQRRYEFAWETVQTLVDMVRPGITAGDIARHGQQRFAAIDRPMGGASRVGHGIGIELTEPPSIMDGDETVLCESMTLSIETGLADWDGYFLMESNLVVTKHGSELLTAAAPRHLPEAR